MSAAPELPTRAAGGISMKAGRGSRVGSRRGPTKLESTPTATGGVAFQSDLYNPGNGGQSVNPAWAQALLDGINTLDVDNGSIV